MSKPTLKEAIAALQTQLEEARVFLCDLKEEAYVVKRQIESPDKSTDIKRLKDKALGIGVQASWWKAKETAVERELSRKCAIRDRIFAAAKQKQLEKEAEAAVKQTMATLGGSKSNNLGAKKRAA